jgi:hypothetical protein
VGCSPPSTQGLQPTTLNQPPTPSIGMAVRVKLLVSTEEGRLTTAALVNSGFEADTPQLLLPMAAAREVGIRPPLGGSEAIYDTAGGAARVWVYPGKARVRLLGEEGGLGDEVGADIVVSPIEDEVLISDQLAGSLRIMVEDFARGIWMIRGSRKRRRSVQPQRWR